MLRFIFYFSLCFLVFFRFWTTKPIYNNGDVVKISGKILSQPTLYDNYQSIGLHGLRINAPKYPEIDYGDFLILSGTVKEGKVTNTKILKVEKSSGLLVRVRKNIVSFYSQNLPINYAALVSGVVIGDKQSITSDFRESLIKAGVIHVVVASGMNVTFVAGFLIGALTLILKRNFAIPFVILGIFVYVLLSGFDAPIVRAAIMGSIVFLAQETGRLSTAWNALLTSGIIMLIIVPSWIFDLGFILSFVATASLMLFQKRIEKLLKFVPGFIKEGLTTTLAAQIGVAPIIFVSFGQFNILSPIINALVLWTIPFIMIIGAFSGVVGLLIPALGSLILFLVYPFVWWFTFILNIFT